jgi:hypothetical protein
MAATANDIFFMMKLRQLLKYPQSARVDYADFMSPAMPLYRALRREYMSAMLTLAAASEAAMILLFVCSAKLLGKAHHAKRSAALKSEQRRLDWLVI